MPILAVKEEISTNSVRFTSFRVFNRPPIVVRFSVPSKESARNLQSVLW